MRLPRLAVGGDGTRVRLVRSSWCHLCATSVAFKRRMAPAAGWKLLKSKEKCIVLRRDETPQRLQFLVI